MKLVFATHNPNKLAEVRAILPDHIRIVSLDDVAFTDDIPETEPTIEGNALQKARFVHERTGLDVFADDTGLEVTALGMEPGVHSARYAGVHGDHEANMAKLLANLEGKADRSARFRTVIALITGDEEHLFEGIVKGVIAKEKKGSEGFGYDPVFIPEFKSHTFAEMPPDEKNLISHRGRAVIKMAAFLKNQDE